MTKAAKILVVEDEMVLRDAFSILLRANAYEVDEAENGQQALDLFRHNTYDLILLDLMMPVLDGIGFLEEAQVQTAAPNTRVVILSNFSSGAVPPEIQALGAHRQGVKANLSTREMVEMVRDELAASDIRQP